MQPYWEENNTAITYSSKRWTREFGSGYHGSAVMRARELGEWASFTFKGSEIRFMGAQGWDHGSFTVDIDGIETVVDGYCCGPNGGMPQIVQFEANNLNRGPHTVNITNLSAGPHGAVLEVDAFIITPHVSRAAQIREQLPVLILFMIMACCFFLRRRLIKHSTLDASLPLSAPARPHDFVPRPRSPPPPPPRSGKGGHHYLAEEDAQGSASSSHAQSPPEYTPAPHSLGGSDNLQHSGRPYPTPLDYGIAPGVRVNDDLVDRIAQRVAGLVHASQSPPQYEGPAATDR